MRKSKIRSRESMKRRESDQRTPDTFVLYRILGNDLYPRHKKGQIRKNLQFVLEHEPDLLNCEKRWIVNRIIDKEEEQAIISLLETHNKPFIHIPFLEEEYLSIGFDTGCLPDPGYLEGKEFKKLYPAQQNRLVAATYRLKNNYVMNNNGARNVALRDGKSRAKWILPWDGNCFITRNAWKQICTDVKASSHLKYFVVPMVRVIDNRQLLKEKFIPKPTEEPQLIFRTDSNEEFNEEFCYGRRSKVEMFWRLGIPGKWDYWKDDPWDPPRRRKSKEANRFGKAGWVARMYSGMVALEQNNRQRWITRFEAIINTLSQLDNVLTDNTSRSYAQSMHRPEIQREGSQQIRFGDHLASIKT